jgi:hypothetical protein
VVTRAATVALDDQIRAVLRDAEGFPVATDDVIAGVGTFAGRVRVGGRLRALTARGEVARETVTGIRSVYWRLAEPPGQQEGEDLCG